MGIFFSLANIIVMNIDRRMLAHREQYFWVTMTVYGQIGFELNRIKGNENNKNCESNATTVCDHQFFDFVLFRFASFEEMQDERHHPKRDESERDAMQVKKCTFVAVFRVRNALIYKLQFTLSSIKSKRSRRLKVRQTKVEFVNAICMQS